MKKILSLILAISVILSMISAVNAAGYKSEYLNNLYVSPVIDLGYPLPNTQFINCTFSKEDGRDVLYTTATGKPTSLVCYDIRDRKIIREIPLVGGKTCWSHGTDSKGNVYIATQSEARVFKFDPITKKLTNFGLVKDPDGVTQTALYNVSFDEQDNAYIGTYPGAYILKVDAKTGEYSFLTNELIPGEKYIRAQVIHNGYIYAGGNSSETKFARYELKTGKIDQLPVFDYNGERMASFNGITPVGDYLFVHFSTTLSRSVMAIYKISENKWFYGDDMVLECNGFYASPELDNKVYVHNRSTSTMFAFDISSETYSDTGIAGSTNRNSKWFELNHPDYPGKTMVTVQSSGTVTYFNPQAKTWKSYDTFAAPQPTEIRCLEPGLNGTIGISQYMGPKMGILNDVSNKISYLAASQIEGMGVAHGELYIGEYPGSNLATVDYENLVRNRFASLDTNGQDRPFSVIEAGEYVAYGTYPGYGKLGGALTLVNPKTKEYEVYANIIKNQTVESLCYKDGKIYGTSSVYGGLGIDPSETDAKLFIFDMASKKVEKEKTISLKNISSNVLFAGKITFAPNGELWAISKGVLFKINPETLDITEEIVVKSGQTWDPKSTRAVPYFIHWLNDTVCITTAGGILSVVDTATKEFKNINGISTEYMAVSENNNVYYASSNRVRLYKFAISIDGTKGFIDSVYDSKGSDTSKYEPVLYENFGFKDLSLIKETEVESGGALLKEVTFSGVSNSEELTGSVKYGVSGTYKTLDLDKYPQKIEIAEKDGKSCIKMTLPHSGLSPILSVPVLKFSDEYPKNAMYQFTMDVYHPDMVEVTDEDQVDLNANPPKVFGKTGMGCYVRFFDEAGNQISDSERAYINPKNSWQTVTVDLSAIPDNASYMKPIIYIATGNASAGTYIYNPVFTKYNENAVEKATINESVILKIDSPYSFVNLFKFRIDKNNSSVVPFVENGRTLVPVRFISESFGASVNWNDAEKKVTIAYGSDKIEVVIGGNKLIKNGVSEALDVPAGIYGGRTMLPLRAVVEALGKTVHWDNRGLIVISDGEVATPDIVEKILKEY